MSISLRIFLIVFVLIYFITLIKKIKGGKLQTSMSIFWLATGIILIVMSAFPGVITHLSKFFGFETTSNMVFFITIFMAYYLIFELTLKLSKEHKRNITLVQEISLLKKEMDDIKK